MDGPPGPRPAREPMEIRFSNFSLTWPGQRTPLLSIADWVIEKGTRLLICGDSGRGKTSLLHCIGGLLDATKGEICIEGLSYRRMTEKGRALLRRDAIAMVFQRVNLIGHLTAAENVMLGAGGGLRIGRENAREALARVGLERAAGRPARHLSAGEQQRAAVARALARRKSITLADEPTANLDDSNALRTIRELLGDARERQTTLIVVSHDHRIRGLFEQVHDIREISDVCPG